MKIKFLDYFMNVAEETAKLSYSNRLKVGSIIVKDGRILSIGYNGTPAGWDNICEDEDNNTKDEVIHAEANAILKLAATSDSCKGAVLFTTHAPCIHCAKLIYQASVGQVVYKYPYRDTAGIEFLNQLNLGTFLYDDLINDKKCIGVIYG